MNGWVKEKGLREGAEGDKGQLQMGDIKKQMRDRRNSPSS